jgi:hypothetical protein
VSGRPDRARRFAARQHELRERERREGEGRLRCPRCGSTSRAERGFAMAPGTDPFSIPPGGPFPRCAHAWHVAA